MKRTIYIGLPCYNEEKDIDTLLKRIVKVRDKVQKEKGYALEIFCVNDGSSDKTEEIIKKHKKNKVRLINHDKNMGLGNAMKTILSEFHKVANPNDFLIVMDADNSHNPEYVLDLIDKQEKEHTDIVIASRYQKGADITGLQKHRIIISDLARFWYTIMLKIPNTRDYTCGYRLYTYDIIDKALKKYGERIITKASFACMMELLYKLYLCDGKVSEIPFLLEYDKKVGTSKMKILKTTKDSLITTLKIRRENIPVFDIFIFFFLFLITIGFLFLSCSTQKISRLVYDPAVYLNVARNVVNGKVLYRDIVDNKGPVLYFINALFLKIGGSTGIIFLEFLLLFVTFSYFYKIIRLFHQNKFQRVLLLGIVLAFYFRFFSHGLSCEEYACCFSSIGLYECLKYYRNGSFRNWQCVLLGILCALCFYIRQNLIVIFVGFGFGIAIKLIIEKKWKELFRYILFSLIGFLVVSVPIFLYLFYNHCFYDYLENTFLLNMTLNKYGYLRSLSVIYCFMPITMPLSFFYFLYLIYQLFREKKLENLGIIFTILFTVIFNIISACVYLHYLIIFIPMILFLYHELLSFDYKYLKFFVYVLMFIVILSNIALFFIGKEDAYLTNDEMIQYVKEHTNSKDKIAVVGFSDEIYYLTKRDSVSRYTYILNNGAFRRENQTKIVSEYLEDIMEGRPKIIVENVEILRIGVSPYIDVKEYQDFIKTYYSAEMSSNGIIIYERKENF